MPRAWSKQHCASLLPMTRCRPCSSAIRHSISSNTPRARSLRARCRPPPSVDCRNCSAVLSASRVDPFLLHGLVGINAPDLAALHPAADVDRLDPAPRATAFEQMGKDAGLGTGDDFRSSIG